MHKDIINRAENVEFIGYKYSEEVAAELPVYTLKEPTVEEWNQRARKQNTKMFISLFNRQPKNYNEVLAWVYNDENRPVAPEAAL